MKIKPIIWLVLAIISIGTARAQKVLTIEGAIELSITNSPDLQKSAMSLQSYQRLLNAQKASLRSQFGLDLNPLTYDKSRRFDSRLSQWYTNETLSTSGTFSITQPIMWTGTTVSLNNRFGWQNNTSDITGIGGSNSNKAFSNSLYLRLDQPLFTFNPLKMDLKTIEMDYENALISYALTRLTLEQRITVQFYQVYMSQENLKISQSELEGAQANLDIIKQKVELDLVPRSEMFQAEINVSTAKSAVENDNVSLASAKDELKQILGLPLREDIETITDVNTSSVYISPQIAIDNALSTRLELRQREIINKMSEFDLIRVKDNGKFKGSVSLSIGIMGDDVNLGRIYDNPTRNPSVSVSFKVPIFDWGARKDRIKAQELKIDMLKIDEEEELKSIELDVLKTCRSLHNLMLQIEIARKSVGNAQQTYDLNVEKYRSGEITGMDMNQFQNQLSSQKLSLAQTMVNYRVELLNLKVISLYDFENNCPISPLLMYSPETLEKFKKHKKNN